MNKKQFHYYKKRLLFNEKHKVKTLGNEMFGGCPNCGHLCSFDEKRCLCSKCGWSWKKERTGKVKPFHQRIMVIKITPKKTLQGEDEMKKDSKGQAWLGMIFIIFVGIVLLLASVVIIDQTEVGVVKTFGQVSGTMGAGIHLVIPFVQEVVRMPTFQKTIDFSGDQRILALSNEGLDVSFDMAIQYAVNPAMAEKVYTDLKDPEAWMHSRVRAKARDIVASYKVESLYTGAERQAVQTKFESELDKEFEQYGIVMKAVLIREVKLPDSVVASIQSKISAKQDAERMEFVIQKETLEKDRKIIEAQGISQANEIIASSITENYLRWYWIQHVVMGANSSIMYVPVGQDGLPLMKTV